jgi:hypothetical protein
VVSRITNGNTVNNIYLFYRDPCLFPERAPLHIRGL